jgi:NADH dehydrogenase
MSRDRGREAAHHVVIVGGGFGGLYAAKKLGRARGVRVTLIDKRNFHLFQPLLYQAATGMLGVGDIASPLRSVLRRRRNVRVLQGEVVDVDPQGKRVVLRDAEIDYDTLVVATGASHHYFGHEEWAEAAPGLKTVENALDIRKRILLAFEAAERETDVQRRRAWLTFVIVGGGPTGVEMAGALAELARETLKRDFRAIDPKDAHILVLEGVDRILSMFPPDLCEKAERALRRRAVAVRTGTKVVGVEPDAVLVEGRDGTERIEARTILWTAGVKASALGEVLSRRTGVERDRSGRVIVGPDLTVPGCPDVFVIGDLAHVRDPDGKPLAGMAPAAMQEGRYVARAIRRRLAAKAVAPFRFRNRGSMVVIGRNTAIVDLGRVHFNGFPAWVIWAIVHIANLIEFENKLVVLVQWSWNYFTKKLGSRLITGRNPVLVLEHEARPERTAREPVPMPPGRERIRELLDRPGQGGGSASGPPAS